MNGTFNSWRVTTAVRVCGLALVLGLMLNHQTYDALGVPYVGLVLVAATCCLLETLGGSVARWTTVAEGVLVAVLLSGPIADQAALAPYLAVPAVVAGLSRGWVTTLNAGFAAMLTLALGWVRPVEVGSVEPSITWLLCGLGVGLLAAWLGRSIRVLEEQQAPYAEAHRLVSQLHSLSRDVGLDFDSAQMARAVLTDVLRRTGAETGALLCRTPDGELVSAAIRGGTDSDSMAARRRAAAVPLRRGRARRYGHRAAWPLRVGDQPFGAVVLERPQELTDGWSNDEVQQVQRALDGAAVRLDTALLFDDVRSLATTAERGRLAREIHDGITQDVASLGFALDVLDGPELTEPLRDHVVAMRSEVSRMLGDLRCSIHDLREQADDAPGLVMALHAIARQAGRTVERVHLVAPEADSPDLPGLPRGTADELTRIAQEAVANVRQHAGATNLWVRLAVDADGLTLRVEDDGSGDVRAREGHFGLTTMRERAARIGAHLDFQARLDGGTAVVVTLPAVDRLTPVLSTRTTTTRSVPPTAAAGPAPTATHHPVTSGTP